MTMAHVVPIPSPKVGTDTEAGVHAPASHAIGRTAHLLAALAGAAAAAASILGFVPGVYRDPPVLVAQSHGYDVANLVVVLILELALLRSWRGSLRGRLIGVGALGCLAYTYVTYAFFTVLNAATPLYIMALACAGWSGLNGVAGFDVVDVDRLVAGRLARRTTAIFLASLAALFGVTWASQMIVAILSGMLPAELQAAGWPMNPVYVLDLGFVLPLAVLGATRLWRRNPDGPCIAVPFLVFAALLAQSILLMATAAAFSGQALAPPMILVFVVMLIVSTALAVRALLPVTRIGGSNQDQQRTCDIEPIR